MYMLLIKQVLIQCQDMKNTKWCFKNSRKLGKIEGKIYALKLMIKGFCSDDNPLLVQIEEIEELVKEIEL